MAIFNLSKSDFLLASLPLAILSPITNEDTNANIPKTTTTINSSNKDIPFCFTLKSINYLNSRHSQLNWKVNICG